MSSFRLHGLWLPVSGLSLWIEKVEGRKIVLPEQVPAGTFPPIASISAAVTLDLPCNDDMFEL